MEVHIRFAFDTHDGRDSAPISLGMGRVSEDQFTIQAFEFRTTEHHLDVAVWDWFEGAGKHHPITHQSPDPIQLGAGKDRELQLGDGSLTCQHWFHQVSPGKTG